MCIGSCEFGGVNGVTLILFCAAPNWMHLSWTSLSTAECSNQDWYQFIFTWKSAKVTWGEETADVRGSTQVRCCYTTTWKKWIAWKMQLLCCELWQIQCLSFMGSQSVRLACGHLCLAPPHPRFNPWLVHVGWNYLRSCHTRLLVAATSKRHVPVTKSPTWHTMRLDAATCWLRHSSSAEWYW